MSDERQQLDHLRNIFDLQRSHYSPSRPPSYEQRIDRLNRLEQLCRDHMDEITAALSADFGDRHPDYSFLADIYPPLVHTKHVKSHLRRWMRRQRVSSGLMALSGQRTYIVNEPLGVVGIMSPFNAPVSLALDPAVDAIAAGNTVILKMSESAPRTADITQALVEKYFKPEEMAVAVGEAEVSKAFAALPWDKLVFTGGSEVGKRVMAAAGENLTPVLLELGGKSPCVVLEDADISKVAPRVARVRQMNAGQVCISVDYVLVPEQHLEPFVQAVLATDREAYPTFLNNEQATSIIHEGAYDRLLSYVDEAREAGCRVILSDRDNEELPNREARKIPLTLVIDPSDELMVAQREAFGPILTIFTYRQLDQAIARINQGEKPLALYVFGNNRSQINRVINRTSSGGVTVNDLLLHAGSHTMGFGGVGYSGMGRYKGGFNGYQAFTNPKSVFEQGLVGRFTVNIAPPITNERVRGWIRRQAGVR